MTLLAIAELVMLTLTVSTILVMAYLVKPIRERLKKNVGEFMLPKVVDIVFGIAATIMMIDIAIIVVTYVYMIILSY